LDEVDEVDAAAADLPACREALGKKVKNILTFRPAEGRFD
jgi:hypothetical protein